MLKFLRQQLLVNPEFYSTKVFSVIGNSKDWLDYETKAKKGTTFEAEIIQDNQKYLNNPEGLTNKRQNLTIKVSKAISLKDGMIVKLVNPVGRLWGDNLQNLSTECEDVQVANSSK